MDIHGTKRHRDGNGSGSGNRKRVHTGGNAERLRVNGKSGAVPLISSGGSS